MPSVIILITLSRCILFGCVALATAKHTDKYVNPRRAIPPREQRRMNMPNEAKLRKALRAAVERMEHVSELLPVEKRHKGVSQRAHVQHLAGHLYQHAKIARAALLKAEGKA